MKTFRVPARPVPLRHSVFLPVALSGTAPGDAKALGRAACRGSVQALLLDLDFDRMDDGGMWAWAGIVAVLSLAFSYGVAIAWRRWKESRKREA